MQKVIVVAGKPYSGVTTVGRYLVNHHNYVCRDMNSFIDSIYLDFKRTLKFDYPDRVMAKNDTIFKNTYTLYQTYGLPEGISCRFMKDWLVMVENLLPEWKVKKRIYSDIADYFPNWRKTYIREDIASLPARDFVVVNPFTLSEATITKNCIIIWIDCDDAHCYQHVVNTFQRYNTDIYDNKYIDAVSKIRPIADFIITNEGSKARLYKQIREMLKVVNENEYKKQLEEEQRKEEELSKAGLQSLR